VISHQFVSNAVHIRILIEDRNVDQPR